MLGIALLAAVATTAWWAKEGGVIRRAAPATMERTEDQPWTAPATAGSGDVPTRWTDAVAQRRGPGWVYDLFTPPEIFFDERAGQFTVVPPASAAAVEPAERTAGNAFGLEVRAVQRPPFRLQLVGYVGGEGSYRGVFENLETGETLLAKDGQRIAGLAARIERFEVVRLAMELPESMTTFRLVARAKVQDELTGATVVLTDLERCYVAPPTALVAMPDAADALQEVREGDKVSVGRVTFTIDRIQLVPPCLDVTKAAADGKAAERRTLAVAETRTEKNL